ncbi:MAG: PQQ-dependent sugar dehydrogenase [Pseudomonadota bacterium]
MLKVIAAAVLLSGPFDDSSRVSVTLTPLAEGLNEAVGGTEQIFGSDLAAFPDGSGRLLVTTLGGPIRLIDETLQATPFLDTFSADTVNGNNGNASFGLTTLVFHPNFALPGQPGSGCFYTVEPEVTRTSPAPDFPGIRPDIGGSNPAHDRVLYEYCMDDIQADVFAGARREVLRIHEHRRGHDVNDLAFDEDQYLLMSVGDTVVEASAQELDNVFGTMLRIDPLAPARRPGSADPISANGAYRIPVDNPFGMLAGALPETYALGLRNPFRIHIDGPDLWVSSNGASSRESVYRVVAGDNLGWPYFEGTRARGGEPSGFSYVPPVFEYDHGLGLSVTGIVIYRGTEIPELAGQAVFSDFLGPGASGARLFVGDPGTGIFRDLEAAAGGVPIPDTIISIGQDLSGEVYLISGEGAVLTVTGGGVIFANGFEGARLQGPG